MSVQFGRWNFEGSQPAQDYIKKVCAILAQYGPDSDESYSNGGITILYRAFHTTKESRRETQPHISRSGVVITWDGRLDNRDDLLVHFPDGLKGDKTEFVPFRDFDGFRETETIDPERDDGLDLLDEQDRGDALDVHGFDLLR